MRRRGLIRRSFILRAMYHGLQHQFGRLDYGRLVNFGLQSIAKIPVVDLERIAYDNFVEHLKPRLYEGVVEHLYALRAQGTAIVLVSSSPRIVLEPLGIYLGCADMLTTPVVIGRAVSSELATAQHVTARERFITPTRWAEEHGISMDETAAYADNWSDRALLGAGGPGGRRASAPQAETACAARGWQIITTSSTQPRRPA